jgi:hypothetical protein
LGQQIEAVTVVTAPCFQALANFTNPLLGFFVAPFMAQADGVNPSVETI